jgi:UDP-N-acetyl-D-mannosaminuronic acid dehydrogenase
MLSQLKQKIERKEAVIGVIGLGYVGLPVAAVFAQTGFQVIGVDIKAERVDLINQGVCPIEGEEPGLADLLAEVAGAGKLQATTDYQRLSPADVILVDVETPVDDNHQPQYLALKAACRALGPVLREGALVIVESTIAPGTMDRVVGPLLAEASGRGLNEDFYLGACPERVMPGKLLANLRQISRVCGGSTPETAQAMIALYRHIVEAGLDAADCVTAELVKTTENAYRDVQIAFANEVAKVCELVGSDVWRVRELVNKSPGRNMHFPGAGVGGHCIPKDGWLLLSNTPATFAARIIPQARAVNESMPNHMFDLTVAALRDQGVAVHEAAVAVMGYAYLENSDDTRHTPSAPFIDRLVAAGAAVRVHDPFVSPYQTDWRKVVADVDAVVFLVAHAAYRQLDLGDLKQRLRHPVLVDGRHIFDPAAVQVAGFTARCIGVAAKI